MPVISKNRISFGLKMSVTSLNIAAYKDIQAQKEQAKHNEDNKIYVHTSKMKFTNITKIEHNTSVQYTDYDKQCSIERHTNPMSRSTISRSQLMYIRHNNTTPMKSIAKDTLLPYNRMIKDIPENTNNNKAIKDNQYHIDENGYMYSVINEQNKITMKPIYVKNIKTGRFIHVKQEQVTL